MVFGPSAKVATLLGENGHLRKHLSALSASAMFNPLSHSHKGGTYGKYPIETVRACFVTSALKPKKLKSQKPA
jgi:hypothetical protein